MLADSYDVILIGESLPGLVATALLARKGHRVLVIDPADPSGPQAPVFKSNGFIFPKGPLLFLGLQREGLYEKVFTELGLSLSLLKKEGAVFARPVPPFQLLLPTHRLNFSSKWEEFLEELRREFPQEHQPAREFSKAIQETGRILDLFHHLPFPQWRPSIKDRSHQFMDLVRYWLILRKLKSISARDYIRSYGLSLEFQKLMELVSLFFYRQPLSGLSALDLVSLLNLIHQEVVEVREGRPNLVKIFVSRLKEHRGEVLRGAHLTGILEERGEVRGIKLEGDRVIKGRVVLTSLAVTAPQGLKQEKNFQSSRMRSYTMFFEIDEEVIPCAMMDHLLFTYDLGQSLEVDNFLYLFLTPREEASSPGPDKPERPKGKRGLRVTCLVPFDRPMLPADREALRIKIQQHLIWLMPFSDGRIGYLGDFFEDPETNKKPDGFLNPSYKLKEVLRYGTKYYTSSLRNLFLLPEDSQSLAATQEGIKSGWDLAQHLTRWLAAELRR